jgi:hypothetical protein
VAAPSLAAYGIVLPTGPPRATIMSTSANAAKTMPSPALAGVTGICNGANSTDWVSRAKTMLKGAGIIAVNGTCPRQTQLRSTCIGVCSECFDFDAGANVSVGGGGRAPFRCVRLAAGLRAMRCSQSSTLKECTALLKVFQRDCSNCRKTVKRLGGQTCEEACTRSAQGDDTHVCADSAVRFYVRVSERIVCFVGREGDAHEYEHAFRSRF